MTINPVLAKELKDRVRTWRSPLLITVYLGVLSLVGGFFYYTQTRFSFGGTNTLRLGIEIFGLLALLELLLIAFLTPGMTAGIISGERERQTLPLLLVTRVSPFAVTWGKLLSAISYILLLIISSLPLFSIVFLFGGVSLLDLLKAAGVLLATTIILGSIGIFFSAAFKRTPVAIVGAYMTTFFLMAGTLFFGIMSRELGSRVLAPGQFPSIPRILYFNPLAALGSALPGSGFIPFSGNGEFGGGPGAMPLWEGYLLTGLVIVLLTTGLTVYLIRPLRKGNRRGE